MSTDLQFIKRVKSTSSVTNVDITDCFTAEYDVYKIILADLDLQGAGDENIALRFLDSGGTVISAGEYDWATYFLYSHAGFSQQRGTSQTEFLYGMGYAPESNNGSLGSVAYIYNPYDSSSFTYLTQQSSTSGGSGGLGNKALGVHKSTEQLSGVRIFVDTGTIERLTTSIYGVK